MERPAYLGGEFAAAFQDHDVARAYAYRPPYPPELFDLLLGLIRVEPRTVLDIGCGRGEIARALAPRVARVDAVDLAAEMIEAGQRALGGDAPNICWIVGPAETVVLDPPYALITGGQSLHWMDWEVMLPRFHDVLVPGGYLAIVDAKPLPPPWQDGLEGIIRHYSTNPTYQPYDMLAAWERTGLFSQAGERRTPATRFAQPIDDYLDAFHAMSSLTRARLGAAATAAFDAEVRALVTPYTEHGMVTLEIQGHLVWGRPHRRRS